MKDSQFRETVPRKSQTEHLGKVQRTCDVIQVLLQCAGEMIYVDLGGIYDKCRRGGSHSYRRKEHPK